METGTTVAVWWSCFLTVSHGASWIACIDRADPLPCAVRSSRCNADRNRLGRRSFETYPPFFRHRLIRTRVIRTRLIRTLVIRNGLLRAAIGVKQNSDRGMTKLLLGHIPRIIRGAVRRKAVSSFYLNLVDSTEPRCFI